jgi:hypothetical protein
MSTNVFDIEDDKNSKFFVEILRDNDDYYKKFQDFVNSTNLTKSKKDEKDEAPIELFNYFGNKIGRNKLYDLIHFFGWQKVLIFITKYSKEIEILVDPNFTLKNLIDNSNEVRNEEYIKNYAQLFMKNGHLNIRYILRYSFFKSINLFLFFYNQLETTPVDSELLDRIAAEQTDLNIVKWLVNNGVTVKHFIYHNYGYDDDFLWTNGAERYFDGEALETLIYLIGCNDNENDGSNKESDRISVYCRGRTNYVFESMLLNMGSGCKLSSKALKLSYSQNCRQLLFRLLIRKVNLDKIFSKSELEAKKRLEEKKIELRLLKNMLDNYFPSTTSQIILLAF